LQDYSVQDYLYEFLRFFQENQLLSWLAQHFSFAFL